MESERLLLWISFNVFVLGMLALDLGVFHRKAHAVSIKEASVWSLVWVSLAMVFNLGIYVAWGPKLALEFLTGYVIEKSLSVDNLFVFLMVFQYFNTPLQYQHRVLFWGILGALVLRAIFIAAGAALLNHFHWMIYVFGGFLVFTGIKMFFQGDEKLEPDKNPVVRLFERCVPVIKEYDGQKFFLRRNGKSYATLLMLVLIVVETTDVIFAVDSIPAIFAVTRDPFIVYTSNVFAILGLRALYFMLAGVMEMFVYLKVGLSFVLCFVGVKMLLVDIYKIPIGVSLLVIGGVLLISILASWIVKRKQAAELRSEVRQMIKAPHRELNFSPSVATFGAAIFCVIAILTVVKWTAINFGPAGHEAIAAIQIAQLKIVEAEYEIALRGSTDANDERLRDARFRLNSAWSHLERKQYSEAIAQAQQTTLALRARAS